MIDTATGPHELLFAEKFKILGYIFNREEKMQDALEEIIQNADKAWWRDVKI